MMTPAAAIRHDPEIAGADGWLMELDIEGIQVTIHPVNGRGAPYRVDVLGNAYFAARTMESAIEFAIGIIEGRIRRAVDRHWLLTLADGFDHAP